ncbi:extracellular solute-binding protein [Orbus wheelerorum]|uniref:extracellular solute-binding protein n=1 Tax=Orbus wheelerorum TaxID=3074111 RepID=UPI00370D38FF
MFNYLTIISKSLMLLGLLAGLYQPFAMANEAELVDNNQPLVIKTEPIIDDSIVDEAQSDEAAINSTVEIPQAPTSPSEKIITSKTFALIGKPKYQVDFMHFDYVNPSAPKGGILKRAEIGTYDNLNRYASRGAPERSSAGIYESLFTQSEDELSSYYPLLASSITYSDKYQWAEVTLNPAAHFSDGVPLTAADVEFTFYKMMTEGASQYRIYYQGVIVKALDKYKVRFELPKANREQLLTFVGNFSVFPQHFWQDKNLAEPLTTPPIGSAPYTVGDYKLGQFVIYQRDNRYWGKDLPVNQGRNNFDAQKIDYFLDDSIALEAFKAGEYDFRTESQPKNWFTQYQGKSFDRNFIIKKQGDINAAIDTRWLAFNIERPIFSDLRVRKALTLAFDFAWLNQAFYYDSYKQPTSFFENTPYAAKGEPSELELKWLQPFSAIMPKAVFGPAYHIPLSDGHGFNRQNLLSAKALLAQAGWVIKDNQLVNQQTGEPFEFELLAYMGSDLKYAIPYQQNLAKLGIKMTITTADYAQTLRRLRKRDYDMIPTLYSAHAYPSSSLIVEWGSAYLDSSWNSSRLHNAAIDFLIEQIPNYIDDEANLQALGRALDRVLTQEYPMIPMWYPRYTYYAYWDKFAQPAIKPLYTIGLNNWWYDSDNAAKLPNHNE